jgi:3-(3-hydroxy-phenyl)propionate hydroxylase
VGERLPDYQVHGPNGAPIRLHELLDDNFLALYFTDVRTRPTISASPSPALRHFIVSRWDAPLDSGLRESSLLDVGERLRLRLGVEPDTLVVIRPDDCVAAILPMATGRAEAVYESIVGMPPPLFTTGVRGDAHE